MPEFSAEITGWLQQALGESPARIAPMPGGGNNRVFQVILPDSRSFLLKHYFRDPADSRNRLRAEFDFARFAWSVGIRCIPRPVAELPSRDLAVYDFVAGRKPLDADLDDRAVQQAMRFIAELNRHGREPAARALAPASEACFSLREHEERIDRRILRLQQALTRTDIDVSTARRFVEQDLLPAWRNIQEKLHRCFDDPAWTAPLAPDQRGLSPSDFGFHNTLLDSRGQLVFFDFEYAGWDDPAKLTGDFFSQVSLPVPLRYVPTVTNTLAGLWPEPDPVLCRMRALLPAYRIKWCCIVLNEFIPQEHRRRSFARGEETEDRRNRQLEKAMKLLGEMDALEASAP